MKSRSSSKIRKESTNAPSAETTHEVRHSSSDGGHVRIAQRAYELYEQRGRQDGHDLDDWIEAERQIHGHSA